MARTAQSAVSDVSSEVTRIRGEIRELKRLQKAAAESHNEASVLKVRDQLALMQRQLQQLEADQAQMIVRTREKERQEGVRKAAERAESNRQKKLEEDGKAKEKSDRHKRHMAELEQQQKDFQKMQDKLEAQRAKASKDAAEAARQVRSRA